MKLIVLSKYLHLIFHEKYLVYYAELPKIIIFLHRRWIHILHVHYIWLVFIIWHYHYHLLIEHNTSCFSGQHKQESYITPLSQYSRAALCKCYQVYRLYWLPTVMTETGCKCKTDIAEIPFKVLFIWWMIKNWIQSKSKF